jgi:hypothetical protein
MPALLILQGPKDTNIPVYNALQLSLSYANKPGSIVKRTFTRQRIIRVLAFFASILY